MKSNSILKDRIVMGYDGKEETLYRILLDAVSDNIILNYSVKNEILNGSFKPYRVICRDKNSTFTICLKTVLLERRKIRLKKIFDNYNEINN